MTGDRVLVPLNQYYNDIIIVDFPLFRPFLDTYCYELWANPCLSPLALWSFRIYVFFFVYVYMCKNQCIRLTLSILFTFKFIHNIGTCYLSEAQVATESSRLKHWPRKTIMVIYNTTITTIIQYVIWVISN